MQFTANMYQFLTSFDLPRRGKASTEVILREKIEPKPREERIRELMAEALREDAELWKELAKR